MKTTDQRAIERYAALLKRLGYPIAFGKIFGYLISSDPPCRSFDQIVTDLRLSKGSVSMVLKEMERRGYVDYFIKTGEKKRYFRISMNRWKQGLEQKLEDSISFTALLSESLAACDPRHRDHRRSISQFIEFERLFQAKMKEIITFFGKRKTGKSS